MPFCGRSQGWLNRLGLEIEIQQFYAAGGEFVYDESRSLDDLN